MRGKNTLSLSQKGMIEAVQHYLDTVLFKEAGMASVRSVRLDRGGTAGGGLGGGDRFEVTLDGNAEAPDD